MAMKGLCKPRRLLRLDEQTRRHIVEVFGGYVPPGTIEPALVLVPQGGIRVTIATMDELTSAGPLDIGVMEIACNSLHHTEGTHAQTGEHVRKCAWCDAIEPMLDEVPDKGRLSVRFERVTATRMVPPEGVDPEAFVEERRYMPSAVAPSADCPSLLGVTRDMWVEENGNVMAAIRWNVPPSSRPFALHLPPNSGVWKPAPDVPLTPEQLDQIPAGAKVRATLPPHAAEVFTLRGPGGFGLNGRGRELWAANGRVVPLAALNNPSNTAVLDVPCWSYAPPPDPEEMAPGEMAPGEAGGFPTKHADPFDARTACARCGARAINHDAVMATLLRRPCSKCGKQLGEETIIEGDPGVWQHSRCPDPHD